MFYPELKEFYDANGFNNNTWSRDLVKRKEIAEKLIGNNQINNDYLLAVWSKIKLDQGLNEERVREKLQLRFETILPFIKIDIIFVVAPQKWFLIKTLQNNLLFNTVCNKDDLFY